MGGNREGDGRVSVNTAKTHRARAINVLRVKFKKLYVMFFCL